MVDENEEVLRRSLDAVDRHRRRLIIGLALGGVLLLMAFMHGSSAIHSGNTMYFLHAVLLILFIWMTMMTLTVVIQITAMTKRILRAIELASRK